MTIVVTRHPALVEYLIQQGLVQKDVEVVSHAKPEEVAGKDVIGVLPLRLAVLARTVTEVPMDIPPEMRGKELTLAQVEKFAGPAVRYAVAHCGFPKPRKS